jgi:hypothetical protein
METHHDIALWHLFVIDSCYQVQTNKIFRKIDHDLKILVCLVYLGEHQYRTID